MIAVIDLFNFSFSAHHNKPVPPSQVSFISTIDNHLHIPTRHTVQREYPFPKDCTFEYLAAQRSDLGSYQVSLFYHMGLIGNWVNIVHDQLDTLEQCGLGYIATDLTITFRNSFLPDNVTIQLLEGMLNQYNFTTSLQTIRFINADSSYPYEWTILQEIHNQCTPDYKNNSPLNRIDPWDSTHKTTMKRIVFYFHNKGCSRYNPSWKTETYDSYYRVLLWRKYMEWFLHERPTLCIKAILLHGAMTCGVQLLTDPMVHYSGNFWAASCDWIQHLNNTKPTGSDRITYTGAEMWIGNQTTFRNNTLNLNLFSIPSPRLYLEPPLLRLFVQPWGAFPERYNRVFSDPTAWPKDKLHLWMDYLSGIV